MGPVEAMQSLSASNTCILEYSKTWTGQDFDRDAVLENPRLKLMVRYATANARAAFVTARSFSVDSAYQAF